ncbi:MAG: helix-turn-helix transcriptional regulator [Flavobacteriales bacterium]|nr:helix-turn-helix transcriptional regulator [Flavobacteriales bacterium]
MKWLKIKDNDIDTYNAYSTVLMKLVEQCIENRKDETENSEVQILQIILNDYDDRHRILTGNKLTAPQLIRIAMMSHGFTKNIEIASELGVGESLISQVLNYKKKVSKNLAKALSQRFDIELEDILRDYPLEGAEIDKVTSILSEKKEELIARKNQILAKINRMNKTVNEIDKMLQESAV